MPATATLALSRSGGRCRRDRHGPLARTELGEWQVQGMDYAYTLQGWIKSVNGQNIGTPMREMGLDGTNTPYTTRKGWMGGDGVMTITEDHRFVAKDAFAYQLHYYDNDYQPVSGDRFFLGANPTWQTGPGVPNKLTALYNGNIAAMSTAMRNEAGSPIALHLYGYTGACPEREAVEGTSSTA